MAWNRKNCHTRGEAKYDRTVVYSEVIYAIRIPMDPPMMPVGNMSVRKRSFHLLSLSHIAEAMNTSCREHSSRGR